MVVCPHHDLTDGYRKWMDGWMDGLVNTSALIEAILLVKNLMKSSLLRVKGIHGSTELGLFDSLIVLILFYQ